MHSQFFQISTYQPLQFSIVFFIIPLQLLLFKFPLRKYFKFDDIFSQEIFLLHTILFFCSYCCFLLIFDIIMLNRKFNGFSFLFIPSIQFGWYNTVENLYGKKSKFLLFNTFSVFLVVPFVSVKDGETGSFTIRCSKAKAKKIKHLFG